MAAADSEIKVSTSDDEPQLVLPLLLPIVSRKVGAMVSSRAASPSVISFTYQLEMFGYLELVNTPINRPPAKTIKLATRASHWVLNKHFPSYVGRGECFPPLFPLACRLAAQGKLRVGDVVQMDNDEIFVLLDGDISLMTALLDRLAEHGLELGMRAPSWKSPGGLVNSRW